MEPGHYAPKHQPTLDELCPEAYTTVIAAKEHTEEFLGIVTAFLTKHRYMALPSDIEGIVDMVADMIADDPTVDRALNEVRDNGGDMSVYPDGEKKLCADAAEKVADNLRIKPLNVSAVLNDMFDGMFKPRKEAL